MARRRREPSVSPEAQAANRAYIEAQIAAGRRPPIPEYFFSPDRDR